MAKVKGQYERKAAKSVPPVKESKPGLFTKAPKDHKKKLGFKRTWVKTPTIYQMEATECGAASLAMVLGYYGCFIPLEQMRIETGVSRDGCNARNILKAARKFGMTCKGYTKSVEALAKIRTPAIIHWNFNHFVVFEGFKGGCPYINDPAVGRRKLTLEELDDAFTGIVLSFKPGDGFQKRKRTSSLYGFIRERLRGQGVAVAALVAAGLLLVAPGLITPVFSQIFIDNILLGGSSDWLGALLIAMAATILFQCLFTWYRGIVLIKLQSKMALVSAYKFLYRLFRLPVSFFDQRYAGDLSQRVVNNNNVSDFLAGELAETALNTFVACFYLILMLIYSPALTVIGVAGVGINLLASHIISKRVSTLSVKAQQDSGKMVGAFYSGLFITSTLKASGAENEYVSRILGHYARNARTEQKLGKAQEILSATPQAISSTAGILVLMAGGTLVINGALTAGMLVAFNQLLSSFTAPINELVGFFNKIQTLKADMSRVEDIQKYEMAPQFLQETFHPMDEKLSGDVQLKDISFGYSLLAGPLIKDFSFHVRPGRSVALVGASGCGKSTVAKIISSLYDPWEGEILVDGIPLRQVPPEIISASIATVSQSITIFTGTIRDNLTLWNKSIMEQDIVNAAKDACIHDTITRLPGAYDFKLTEEGQNLSGGQRQRLEIARALVLNPSILVMDEATSALDPIVEKKIMDNIKRRGCTCIIVAHRLSTIRDCDEILVMQKGQIVQRGTHEELRDQEGLYRLLISNE
ncbi:MAG: NHLP family bacteriocin export ABC transporter peptidase/permease/ATPase subunit [Oscillospiraceae bacterium]|nr:NHLP family bacteriocin export ABC transporter peptidase/permease/ATPase subunit [Oscillospiraceae bacterium]